jgi:hypothetical protein
MKRHGVSNVLGLGKTQNDNPRIAMTMNEVFERRLVCVYAKLNNSFLDLGLNRPEVVGWTKSG